MFSISNTWLWYAIFRRFTAKSFIPKVKQQDTAQDQYTRTWCSPPETLIRTGVLWLYVKTLIAAISYVGWHYGYMKNFYHRGFMLNCIKCLAQYLQLTLPLVQEELHSVGKKSLVTHINKLHTQCIGNT